MARRFWHARREHLVVGDDGVSWLDYAKGAFVSVRYSTCAALVVEGPLLTLLGEDGTRLFVHRDYWKGGEEVARQIMAAIPASRVVRIDTPE